MPKPSGPRRQVLARRQKESQPKVAESYERNLLKQASLPPQRPAQTLKVKAVHTSARALRVPAPVAAPSTAAASSLHIHASSTPAIVEDQPYTINVSQNIQYTDLKGQKQAADRSNLTFTKKFMSAGSKSTIDPSLIHSVYPPPGHSDYWNILPHVLFSDPETPWMFETPWLDGDPWLALFVFTHEELLVSNENLEKIASPIRARDPTVTLVQNTTLATPMTNADFGLLAPSGAEALGPGKAWGTGQTQAIFIPSDLYQGIMPRDKIKSPWLMSHVRCVDVTGMTNMDATDGGTFAVTVSQRTGPLNPAAPSTVYAHLVVIPGRDGSGTALTTVGLTGLCSLYSWSYTCLPSSGLSVQQMLENLGDSIQPLRMPAQTLADAVTQTEPWVMKRLKAGYSLTRYRTLLGEVTMAMMRGVLVPNNPYDLSLPSKSLASSDFGGDLAVIDKDSGLIDVTYQMAWTLGRSLAMSDRSFSAALMRLRGAIHNVNIKATKKAMDKNSTAPVHKTISEATKDLSNAKSFLANAAKRTKTSNFKNRWSKPALRPSSRDVYSFAHPEVQDEYKKGLHTTAYDIATAATPDPRKPTDVTYDETNPPASTDWATVFAWIMDKWYLGGIPILHLIPDPSFVPKESIRTFYIDPIWLRSLFDGALSIAEHYTEEDDARDAIKAAFEVYLVSNHPTTPYNPPQLPRFGLFLRSDLIKKFPNLHITAPYKANYENWQNLSDAVRVETLDEDLLLLLFDRIPGTDAFEAGITIQPPGHQLSFTFGNGGWTFSDSTQMVTEEWRSILVPQYDSVVDPAGTGKVDYSSTSSPARGFDFKYNILLPADLGTDARGSVLIGGEKDSLSALLGAQLISAFPKLTLVDAPLSDLDKSPRFPLQRVRWTCTADSEQGPDMLGINVLDGDNTTFWHTEWRDGNPPGLPHTITIDMKAVYMTGGLTYLPRQDATLNGTIGQYEILVSEDNDIHNTMVTGTWNLDQTLKTATWDPWPMRYIRLKAITGSGVWTTAAEINVLSSETALPPNTLKTAKRAPIQKYPPLANQDPRPTLPPPPAPAASSPIPLRSSPPPPKLLQVLAQVNINDKTVFQRYLEGADTQPQIDSGPSEGFLVSQLECYIYNLRSKLGAHHENFKIAKPNIPHYPLDLHFYLQLDYGADAATRILEKVVVTVPYGDNALLQPFPSESPSTNPITPPGSLNDPYVDAPLKNRGTGMKLPTVRFTGIGQRYRALVSSDYDSHLFITLYPLIMPTAQNADAQRLYNNPDLSFVLEGVEVSGTKPAGTMGGAGQTYAIDVEEHYSSWEHTDGDTSKGIALRGVLVPVYLMEPDY